MRDQIAFGRGFRVAKGHPLHAVDNNLIFGPLYNVDISNGMPIISEKSYGVSKGPSKGPSSGVQKSVAKGPTDQADAGPKVKPKVKPKKGVKT